MFYNVEIHFRIQQKIRTNILTEGGNMIRGGFGEPYCSEECREEGGRYIAAVMLKNQNRCLRNLPVSCTGIYVWVIKLCNSAL